MEFRKLSECALDDAVLAWNLGFEGYYAPMQITNDIFIKRMVQEDLSPELSIVAYDNGKPVAIVMNGTRVIGNQKVAWNGGTGIAITHRGSGLSSLLMREVLKIYEGENVELATLEAIEENEKAIRLYQKFGYKIDANLLFLEKTSSVNDWKEAKGYTFETTHPEQLSFLSFYNKKVPWQCHYQSVKTGEAMLAYKDRELVGYALYKRIFNESGKVEKLNLYQVHSASLELLPTILKKLHFDSLQPITITAVNFIASDPVTEYMLTQGFERKVGQVYMTKNI